MKVDKDLMALLKAVKKASTPPAISIDRIRRNDRSVEETSAEVSKPLRRAQLQRQFENHLQTAEQHVREAEEHVARQRQVATRMREMGFNSQLADSLLAEFEITLAQHRMHLTRLQETQGKNPPGDPDGPT